MKVLQGGLESEKSYHEGNEGVIGERKKSIMEVMNTNSTYSDDKDFETIQEVEKMLIKEEDFETVRKVVVSNRKELNDSSEYFNKSYVDQSRHDSCRSEPRRRETPEHPTNPIRSTTSNILNQNIFQPQSKEVPSVNVLKVPMTQKYNILMNRSKEHPSHIHKIVSNPMETPVQGPVLGSMGQNSGLLPALGSQAPDLDRTLNIGKKEGFIKGLRMEGEKVRVVSERKEEELGGGDGIFEEMSRF